MRVVLALRPHCPGSPCAGPCSHSGASQPVHTRYRGQQSQRCISTRTHQIQGSVVIAVHLKMYTLDTGVSSHVVVVALRYVTAVFSWLVSSPRKTATSCGWSQRDLGVRCVGLEGQLKRCTVVWALCPQSGQLSDSVSLAFILYRQLFKQEEYPERSCDRKVLVLRGRSRSP